VLIAVLALVTIALVAEFAILLADQLGGDDKDQAAADSSTLTVPKGRPIVAATLQVRDGVEQAAKAAQEIVSVDYKKYDDEVDKAADLMTSRFAKQYRTTAGDIKDQVVGQQTTVQASVVAQGAVRANRTRLEALIFLNQVVERTRDGKKQTVVTPFKVLVTMVHTDHGWLVDRLDTDAPGEKPAAAPSSGPSGAVSPGTP
jgi:Mce-associated membrane protein